MERFFSKRTPETILPHEPEEKINNQRRLILKAALTTAVGAVVKGDTFEEPVESEAPPTPEEISQFEKAKKDVDACVQKIREQPFMEKPLRARAQVEAVETNPNLRSVVLGVEENGVSRALHIPDVGALSRGVGSDRGKGVYVHTEGESRYRITLTDSPVDIGVSNRFAIEKHVRGGLPQEIVLSNAVRRARYVPNRVTKEVVRKGKKEKVTVDEGSYVEYVTYVPPAEHLVTKESIESGKEYVNVVLDSAHTVLSARLPNADKKILALCRDITKRLAVVEHVDPYIFLNAEKKRSTDTVEQRRARMKMLYDRMYAEFGLNQDKAFNHLINGQGAGGMMQIIRRTYTDIRHRLIERRVFLSDEIPEDANVGRRDPLISAIIALYLCYDNYLPRAKFFKGMRDDEIELSLVVMYNGSPNLYQQIQKGNKPVKKKNNTETPKEHPPTHYENPTDFILQMLNHTHGEKLPGSGESENRNYVRKYLTLKHIVEGR